MPIAAMHTIVIKIIAIAFDIIIAIIVAFIVTFTTFQLMFALVKTYQSSCYSI